MDLYHIRTALGSDVLTIYQFNCQLENEKFEFNQFGDIYEQNIADPNFIYLVSVSEKNEVVGYISCHTQRLLHHCGRVAEIQELFVTDQFRGQGIGKELVNALEKRLANCVLVEVTAQNKRIQTHEFYELLGFAPTHKKFVKHLKMK